MLKAIKSSRTMNTRSDYAENGLPRPKILTGFEDLQRAVRNLALARRLFSVLRSNESRNEFIRCYQNYKKLRKIHFKRKVDSVPSLSSSSSTSSNSSSTSSSSYSNSTSNSTSLANNNGHSHHNSINNISNSNGHSTSSSRDKLKQLLEEFKWAQYSKENRRICCLACKLTGKINSLTLAGGAIVTDKISSLRQVLARHVAITDHRSAVAMLKKQSRNIAKSKTNGHAQLGPALFPIPQGPAPRALQGSRKGQTVVLKNGQTAALTQRQRAMIQWFIRHQCSLEQLLQCSRIAFAILKHLTVADLMRLRLVSKQMKDLMRMPKLWRVVRLRNLNVSDWIQFFGFHLVNQQVQVLDFRHCPVQRDEGVWSQIEASMHLLVQCRSLLFSELPIHLFPRLGQFFPHLRELMVENLITLADQESECQLEFDMNWLKDFDSLKTLKLGSTRNIRFRMADCVPCVHSVRELMFAFPRSDVSLHWSFISQFCGLQRLIYFDGSGSLLFPADPTEKLPNLEEIVLISEGSFRVKCASRNGSILRALKQCRWVKRLRWLLVGDLGGAVRSEFVVDPTDRRIPLVIVKNGQEEEVLNLMSTDEIKKELGDCLPQTQVTVHLCTCQV